MKSVIHGSVIHLFRAGISAFLILASSAAYATTCVVNLERADSAITEVVKSVFVGAPGVELHEEAGPGDFLGCIQSRAEEIVLIGHALENPATMKNGAANLGYFVRLGGADLQALLQEQMEALRTRIRAIDKALLAPGLAEGARANLRAERSEGIKLINKYASWPPNRPTYQIKPLMPRVMEVARRELENQARSPQGVSLKRIRLMSCLSQLVLNQYGGLRALLKENSIVLDIAPENAIASWLDGQPVTSPNIEWLARSVDCWALKSWKTDRNSWCEEDYWQDCDRRSARYCLPR